MENNWKDLLCFVIGEAQESSIHDKVCSSMAGAYIFNKKNLIFFPRYIGISGIALAMGDKDIQPVS